MSRHLKLPNGEGQFVNCGPMVRVGVLVLLMVLLGFGGVGCGSIYSKTQAKLPPEPLPQLQFRIKEAQRAEQLAGQSMTQLRDQLKNGLSAPAIDADVDRVAAATFEFDRRVASVLDAAAHCEGQTQLASEIERLQVRSKKMLADVETVRREGDSINVRQLDDLIRGSAEP